MTRVVWGMGTPRTFRPLWILEELGLDYEHRPVSSRGPGMDDPRLRAQTQRHKIPFYEDDIVKIGESAAIVTYLADRHGGDLLVMPAPGTVERAVLLDRTMFIMTEIDARMYTVRLHDGPPLGLSDVYGAAPMAVEAAKEYVGRGLNEANRWLGDGQPYVLGEHFGTPDILLTSCLEWARLLGIRMPAVLAEYHQRITSRPSYQKAMKRNFPSNASPESVALG